MIVRFEPADRIDPDTYEEWITYPDKRAYVRHEDQLSYANRPGWFRSGWTCDEATAIRRNAVNRLQGTTA